MEAWGREKELKARGLLHTTTPSYAIENMTLTSPQPGEPSISKVRKIVSQRENRESIGGGSYVRDSTGAAANSQYQKTLRKRSAIQPR
jgi:hypothetical protein